jgi:hypothetical protein
LIHFSEIFLSLLFSSDPMPSRRLRRAWFPPQKQQETIQYTKRYCPISNLGRSQARTSFSEAKDLNRASAVMRECIRESDPREEKQSKAPKKPPEKASN